MPIMMVSPYGRNCPTIVCDAYKEPVVEHGNVLWDPDVPDRLYYVHKGRCNDAIEQACAPAYLYWEELSWFLVYVANNAKFSPRILVKKEAWMKHVNI
jgi:hypothetical protein